jgi:phenylpropionate dioxygenase-like ring-hydroxylating dioxygenase large terminal subunit
LKNQWYIIATTDEFKSKRYINRKLLNQPVLIGLSSDEHFFAIEDRCCHRNVALSLGEFKNDIFTCGYHGWKYNTKGKCIDIPSMNGKIPETACVNSYPLKVEFGFIWIALETANHEHFQFKELLTEPYIYTRHQFEGDLKFVSESLFDPFHINHVHKNSIKSFMGDLTSDLPDLKFTSTEKSLVGSYKRINNGSFYDKKYFGNDEMIETHFEFHFPNISKLKICFPKRTLTIYEHICETEDGKIDMIQITSWDNIFKKFPFFSKWFMKKISDKIVNEDIEFFKSHKQTQAANIYKDIHIKSDQLSIEFRRIWEKQMESN